MTAAELIASGPSDKVVQTLKAIARDSARRGLQVSLHSTPFTEAELPPDKDLSFDHWVTAIMLSSKVFKLSFSARFTSKSARALVAHALGQEPDQVKPAVAHDNMGEFCNLTVGYIKKFLIQANSALGDSAMSTPKSNPSFDLGGEEVRNLGTYGDKWLLQFDGHEFLCAINMDVSDWTVLGDLQEAEIDQLSVSDGGDIDFF